MPRPPSRSPINEGLNQAIHRADAEGSLLTLSLLALVVGAIAGVVGAIFRVLLEQANQLRGLLVAWAHGQKAMGLLLVLVGCAAATALAAWLVRRYSPQASGSGIPLLKQSFMGEFNRLHSA